MIDFEQYADWLIREKGLSAATVSSRVACVRRVNKYYDVEKEYNIDRCKCLLERLGYSVKDQKEDIAPGYDFGIKGDYHGGMASLKCAIKQCREYLDCRTAMLASLPYGSVSPAYIPKKIEETDEPNRLGSISYGDDVGEEERVPGLLHFLHSELEPLCAVFYRLFGTSFSFSEDRFPYEIPLVLSKEMIIEHHRESDDITLIKIRSVADNKNLSPTQKMKEVNRILELQYFSDRLLGSYFYGEKGASPHIEIYYRNFSCKTVDQYKASLVQCLAHEMFHYFHDMIARKEYRRDSYQRNFVIEGCADFFSVMYLINSASDSVEGNESRIACAENRYDSWNKRFGSVWPYAHALSVYQNHEVRLPFSSDPDSFERTGELEKFKKILNASRESIEKAYEILEQ